MPRKLKADPAFHLEHYQHPDKFGKWLGYKVRRVDRKNWVVISELKIREDHLSPAGRVHGGVVSALFDFSCGAAVFSTMEPKDYASTVELKVNYFRPLEIGDRLKCEARVVFRGKRLCVIYSTLHRRGEKGMIAMATATFNIVAGDKRR
jgi:acyl-CoA thioesterase